MVTLNEKHHRDGTPPRLQETEVGRAFRSWELGVRTGWKLCTAKCELPGAGHGLTRSGKTVDAHSLQGSTATDQKFGSSGGLPCSGGLPRDFGRSDLYNLQRTATPDNKDQWKMEFDLNIGDSEDIPNLDPALGDNLDLLLGADGMLAVGDVISSRCSRTAQLT